MVKSVAEQMAVLKRGVAEIIDESELADKLERSKNENRPLRVKWGVDPTAPDIHLGHTVVLHKLKQFQDLGHEVILLIGDFTGCVGDPSGRDEVRKQLSDEVVAHNAETYIQQVMKVLDQKRTIVEYNSKWLAKLTFSDVVGIASKFTVARMLEREDFQKRFKEQVAIYLHEFFYPLMQGYDSVALSADVELGGTEQRFNILTARDIQRAFGQEPEVAVLMPILEGTDGVKRMSKSTGNYIGIDERPEQIYGKVMSVPDEVMIRYFTLATDIDEAEIDAIKTKLDEQSMHPRDAKMMLAHRIVSMYWGKDKADRAETEFKQVFQQNKQPTDIPLVEITSEQIADVSEHGKVRVSKMLMLTGLVSSNGEAKRAIKGGGVRIDGDKVTDEHFRFKIYSGMVLSFGKRKLVKVVIV